MSNKSLSGGSVSRSAINMASLGAGLLAVLGGCSIAGMTPYSLVGTSLSSTDTLKHAATAAALLVGALVLLVSVRVVTELMILALWRLRGVPVLSLGDFRDYAALLPGLSHQVAYYLDNAGMATYDEKGGVPPEFNLLMGTAYTQAELIGRLLRVIMTPRVRRLSCDVGMVDGNVIGCSSLTDSSSGFVRYLPLVVVDPQDFTSIGDQVNFMAQRLADVALSELARDPNTRGLLLQRVGDYGAALVAFQAAVAARGANHLRAAMNLGNLYSLMHLHNRAVAVLSAAAEKAQQPLDVALLQASLACAYRSWERDSTPVEKGAYDWLARQALDHAVAYKAESPLLQYTIACYYALSGNKQETLSRLREAVASNVEFLRSAMEDPDLKDLRDHLGHSLAEELGMTPPWHHFPPRKPGEAPPPTIPPGGPPPGSIYSPVPPATYPGYGSTWPAPTAPATTPTQPYPPLTSTPPPGAAPERPWTPLVPVTTPTPVAGPPAPVVSSPIAPVVAAPVAPGQPGAAPAETLRPPAGPGNRT